MCLTKCIYFLSTTTYNKPTNNWCLSFDNILSCSLFSSSGGYLVDGTNRYSSGLGLMIRLHRNDILVWLSVSVGFFLKPNNFISLPKPEQLCTERKAALLCWQTCLASLLHCQYVKLWAYNTYRVNTGHLTSSQI